MRLSCNLSKNFYLKQVNWERCLQISVEADGSVCFLLEGGKIQNMVARRRRGKKLPAKAVSQENCFVLEKHWKIMFVVFTLNIFLSINSTRKT